MGNTPTELFDDPLVPRQTGVTETDVIGHGQWRGQQAHQGVWVDLGLGAAPGDLHVQPYQLNLVKPRRAFGDTAVQIQIQTGQLDLHHRTVAIDT